MTRSPVAARLLATFKPAGPKVQYTAMVNLSSATPGMFVFTGAAQNTRLSDPADLPTLTANGVRGLAFNGSRTKLAILSQTSTNSISVYDITQNPPVRIAVFSTPHDAIAIDWSRDDRYIAVALAGVAGSEGFALYDTTNSYAQILPPSWTGTGSNGLAFNKESTRIFVIDNANTVIRVYSISGGSLSLDTSLTPHFTSGAVTSQSISISDDGTLLALAMNDTIQPFNTWVISSAGTVYTHDTTYPNMPGGTGSFAPRDICISPDKTKIVVVGIASPFMLMFNYPAMTKRTDPASLPSSFTDGCTFNPSGTELLLTGSYSGNLEGYTVSSMTKFVRALSMGPTIWRIKAMER